jgi:hypothetical protein
MMRLSGSSVRLSFDKAAYPRESLEAAALSLGEGVRVSLADSGRRRLVVIRPSATPRASQGRLRALAGAFADAALNHAYRQRVVRFHGKLSAALLSPLFERGFKAVPADPLEQLEPQVLRDRTRDTEALLEKARRLRNS